MSHCLPQELEKTTQKIARWTNNRHFNVRCVHNNIVPSSIKLKSNVKGLSANKILQKAEKKLLNIRISQCTFTIKKLEERNIQNKTALFERLSAKDKQEVDLFLKERHIHAFENTKAKQREKYDKLLEKEKRKNDGNYDKDEHAQIKKRWVVNLSDIRLEPEANSLLRRGLNFAVTPKTLPVDEIITATEVACQQLNPSQAQQLRTDTAKAIKRSRNPTSNLSSGERKALIDLKKNQNVMVLAADKGRATVLMNTVDYKNKIMDLLNDTNIYERLKKDPTKSYKDKFINILRKWKTEKTITDTIYHKIYPTSDTIAKFYGLPKIHKPSVPLRPIVSSIGNITCGLSKYLTQILSPLMGKGPHFIKNSADFVKKIKDLEIPPGRCMISYDVTALFTSIPVDKAIRVIEQKLRNDPTLSQRCELNIDQITTLLTFCLNTTYFTYDKIIYKQKHGAAMGSSVSPVVANLYMEDFEEKAISSAPNPPHVW